MHAGNQTKMLPGAVVASVIPMIFGLAGLLLTYKGFQNGLSSQNFLGSFYHLMSPIAFSFLFGTPIAALMACLRLRKIGSLNLLVQWSSSFITGFTSAIFVQFVFSTIYVFGTFYLVEIGTLTPVRGDPPHIQGTITLFVVANLISGIFITLPFSLLCSSIFWGVTKFPESTAYP